VTRHGLPDVYPYNAPGYNESQAEKAEWVVYEGISDGSEWHLRDGTLLEIWPGGDVFNERGTLCGRLRQVGFGEKPGADEPGETPCR
jgi:hypothetical protein